jgi:hypothetical protein
MFRLPLACLAAVLLSVSVAPGDAAAQYSGGGRGGGYFGGGGGYHAGDGPPRTERRQRQNSGGAQCYTKRSKGQNGQWQSQTVCE